MLRQGKFAGPVAGLRFETPTCAGFTDEDGTFEYRDHEVVVFSVGGVTLGAARGTGRLTAADIVARVDGDINKLADPGFTNIARFLQTLDQDGNLDSGITLTPEIHAAVRDRPISLGYQIMTLPGASPDPVQAFTEDPALAELLRDLNQANVFTSAGQRALRTPAAARNEVRRNILGIRRYRDVQIPLRNGSFVYADVYRPDHGDPVPVVMNCGVYGRAFVHHSVCSGGDAEHHEAMEERYFLGNSDGYEFENHESINTAAWIPRGYALVRVDSPGAGKSPGTLGVWGIDEAEAYFDAIEWAGTQPWSNGNVGLWGMSYYAVNQHAVASLQPPHLKAMIAIGTDADLYEEFMYTGGILNEEFFPGWFQNAIVPAVCGEVKAKDFMAIAKASPFKDSDPDRIFGPRAEVLMSPDLSKVTVPLWSVAATTHPSHLHQLGSSETYLNTPTTNKKLDFWEDWFLKSYSAAAVDDHVAFFDHWLKGIDNGIMDKPPVRLEVRSGGGASYLQEEHEWPVARTEYVKWYLDAGRRLSRREPGAERSVTYSAESGPALIPGISNRFYPLAKGWLKVSHRKLDTKRSTDFRPKHTHLRADYAPLRAGEAVPVEVEIIPNVGLVRKGHRIRLDVQPFTGIGHGMRHGYDASYHADAENTIYTGPEHPGSPRLFVPEARFSTPEQLAARIAEQTGQGRGPRRGGLVRSLVSGTGVALGMADHAMEAFRGAVGKRSARNRADGSLRHGGPPVSRRRRLYLGCVQLSDRDALPRVRRVGDHEAPAPPVDRA